MESDNDNESEREVGREFGASLRLAEERFEKDTGRGMNDRKIIIISRNNIIRISIYCVAKWDVAQEIERN